MRLTEGQVRINRSHATAFHRLQLASFISITDVESAKLDFSLSRTFRGRRLCFIFIFLWSASRVTVRWDPPPSWLFQFQHHH